MQSNLFPSFKNEANIWGLPNVKEGFLQDKSKGDKNLIHFIPPDAYIYIIHITSGRRKYALNIHMFQMIWTSLKYDSLW